MAVQAQYPSLAFPPPQEHRTSVLDGTLFPTYGGDQGFSGFPQPVLANGTVLSDLGSDLTCNASGSRKRSRDEPVLMAFLAQQQQQQQQQLVDFHGVSTGLQLSLEEGNRLRQSALTSTSGRLHATPSAAPRAISPLVQELLPSLCQHNLELDALIRLQHEKLRAGMEVARKRHCRSIMSLMGQHVQKRLKEKDDELAAASRRNAELEDKVKQIAAENQIWFNMAKNNEAVVTSLRGSLEQVLARNAGAVKEGFGDSESDAESCCFQGTAAATAVAPAVAGRRRTGCRRCGSEEVSVLVLPCRHLCMCATCGPAVDTCPVCGASKNAILQVFLP